MATDLKHGPIRCIREGSATCAPTKVGFSAQLRGMLTGWLLLITLSVGAETAFYVAPGGNDAWSGQLRETNAAKADGPFASLARARDAIRHLKQRAPLTEPVTVWIRGGTYCLPKTFALEAADSGTAAAPVTYRAVPGETPRLVGGLPITGFTVHRQSILKADVARQGFGDVAFGQLFCDGQRQHLARYPNYDPRNPIGGGWAYVGGKLAEKYQDLPEDNRRALHYAETDARHWQRPNEGKVLVFPRYNWWNNYLPITAVDAQKCSLTLGADASYALRPGDRYYIAGLEEELDAPGEWYLDRQRGTLYFWPPGPLEGKEVYAPLVKDIVTLGPGTAYVTLRGLHLECAENAAVVLNKAEHCRVAGCTIRNVSGYHDAGVAVNGGRDNGVIGCDIFDVGSHGIALGGGDISLKQDDQKTLIPAGNYAENNHIARVGVFYKQGCGVSVAGVGNRVSRNLIHHVPRWCIGPTGNRHVIELNHLHHASLETEDTGAIYIHSIDWLSGRGTVIRHNFIHDVIGFGRDPKTQQWTSPYFAWGIYLDWSASGIQVLGNIVARTPRGGIMLHDGRDNRVENNIVVDGGQQQIELSGWTVNTHYWPDGMNRFKWVDRYESVAGQAAWQAPDLKLCDPRQAALPDGHTMHGNVVARNVLYYRDPQAKAFHFRNVVADQNPSRQNVVWNLGQPIRTDAFRAGKATGDNLLPQGGFEDSTAGSAPKGWAWHIRPGKQDDAAVVDQSPHAGRLCLRVTGRPDAANRDKPSWARIPSFRTEELTAVPGQGYRLVVWLKAAEPNTRFEIGAQAYRANQYHWLAAKSFKVGTDWAPYELTFQFPGPKQADHHPDMKRFYVRLRLEGESGTVWADDVELTLVELLSPWQSWQAEGQDRDSLVADPLFVDAAHDDYRLKAGSPALKLGFQPIPVDKVGCYQDELRASWPIVEERQKSNP